MITLVRTTEVVPLTEHPDAEVIVIEAPVNARRFNTLAHRLFDALGQTSAATGNRVTATKQALRADPWVSFGLVGVGSSRRGRGGRGR